MSAPACPVPYREHEVVSLAHGDGGRLSRELFEQVFLPAFDNPTLRAAGDQAVLEAPGGRIAMTTDGFVVDPVFFPGGNIGDLAINGTVNDLAVGGAVPRWVTASFILEEGLRLADLDRIARTMGHAAAEAGVSIVAGDTKVVQRGKGDQVFISTTGIGQVPTGVDLGMHRVAPGQIVVLSGTIGDHGTTILSARGELGLQTDLTSDTAPLHHLAQAILNAGPRTAFMRDPTRGGLATTLNEVCLGAGVGIDIRESSVPVRADVRGACELLGLDPLYVANEGKLVAFVHPDEEGAVLAAARGLNEGRDAVAIGNVVADHVGMVVADTGVGGTRVVDLLDGAQLPRIC